jgi:LacI family transcriptional regulator
VASHVLSLCIKIWECAFPSLDWSFETLNGNSGTSVTLLEVAQRAGVSLSTASRVLNGSSRRVRADLSRRVVDAAHALDYTPNAQAQAMARGQTNIVGLVVQDIADPYFSSIAGGVMSAAEQHHLLVTLASTGRRPKREVEYVAALRAQRSRAIILAGSRSANPGEIASIRHEITAFERAGGHVVAISQQVLGVDTIVIENRAGASALSNELVTLGYRRFAVLAGPPELLTARDRLRGYRHGLSLHGLDLVEGGVVYGPFTRDGGCAAMSTLLDRNVEVDCVLVVNDVMAVGAMAACRVRGLTLPDDLAIAGFDDIETLRDITPALTTVRLPLEDIGAMALELVTTAKQDARPRVRRLRGKVVVRASTPDRR